MSAEKLTGLMSFSQSRSPESKLPRLYSAPPPSPTDLSAAWPRQWIGVLDRKAYTLSLVRWKPDERDPLHWALILSHVDHLPPYPIFFAIYEVRGDVRAMRFDTAKGYRVSGLDNVHSVYTLALLDQDDVGTIREVAESEESPRAEARTEAIEKCQDWCVRVVRKLAEKGLVGEHKADMMEALRQGLEEFNPLDHDPGPKNE